MKKNTKKVAYKGYKQAHLISMIGTIVLAASIVIAVIVMVTCFKVEVKVENTPAPTTTVQQPTEKTPSQELVVEEPIKDTDTIDTANEDTTPVVTPIIEEPITEAAETEKYNPVEVITAETEEPVEVQPVEADPEAAETEENNPVIIPEETEEPEEAPADPVEEEPVEVQYSTATVLVKVYSKYNGTIDHCTESMYTFTREIGYVLTKQEINNEISALYPSAKNIIISTKLPEEVTFTSENITLDGNVRVKMY